MAKDEIVRTANGAAESVAVNVKKSEMDALLLKKKGVEVAEKEAEKDAQAADDQAAAPAEAEVVAVVADASDATGIATDAGVSPSMLLTGASAAGETGGISNTTLLVGGGVLLAGGAIAIASNSGGGGGSSNDGDVASITPSLAAVNEQASQVTFTIQGNAGATVAYTLTGTAKLGEDYTVSPANSVTFDSNGVAVVTVTTVADNKTEGAETIILTAAGVSSTITVNDTSLTPAQVISIVPDGDGSIVEGETVDFTLTGLAGSTVAFTLGGSAGAADYTVDPAGGTVTFDATGIAHVRVTATSDNNPEGAETLTLTAGGVTSVPVVTITDAAPGTFQLTANTDVATATTFVAGLVFTPGGNDRVNSLQDEDVLTGTGAAVLNATIGNANDNGDSLINPTLTGIQTVNVAFSTTSGAALDLQDAAGVTNLNITRVANETFAGVLNLDKTTTELSVANSSALADVEITYRNNALSGATDDVNLALTNVLLDTLYVGPQNTGTPTAQQIEKLDTTVNSDSQIGFFDTASIDDQALTFDLKNAGLRIGRDSNENGTVFDDGSAFNSGLDEAGIASIVVTGAGNIDIAEVGSDDAFLFDSTALVGNAFVNITAAAGDDLAKFNTGAGNDKILSTVSLFGDVSTAAGADEVEIVGDLITANVAGKLQSGSIDSGEGNDVVAVSGNLQGSVGGGSSVTLGAGDDTFVLGIPRGDAAASGNEELLSEDSALLGATEGRAQYNTVFVPFSGGNIGEEASVVGGAGIDTVILTGTVAADTEAGLDEDFKGGMIDLGTENDLLYFDRTGRGSVETLIGKGALVAGGAGSNVLTVEGNTAADVVAIGDLDKNDVTDVLLTGFQTVNLISEQSINLTGNGGVVNSVFEVADKLVSNEVGAQSILALPVVNDTDSATADYLLDLLATTDIATINLRNDAGVFNVLPEEGKNAFLIEGDDAVYTLENLLGTEAVNLRTVETLTDAGGTRTGSLINTDGTKNPGHDKVLDDVIVPGGLDTVTPPDVIKLPPVGFDENSLFSATSLFFGDTSADAILEVALRDGTGKTDSFAVTLSGEGDVAIDDIWNSATDIVNKGPIENLSIVVNDSVGTDTADGNFSQGVRAITLNSDDFKSELKLSGNSTDTIVVSDIAATKIESTLSGNVVLEVASKGDLSIKTAGGNDVVDLQDDTVNAGDTIDLGAGRNTLIIDHDIRVDNADGDESFDNITNVQILELRGDTSAITKGAAGTPGLDVTLDDDAQDAGIDTLVLSGTQVSNLTTYNSTSTPADTVALDGNFTEIDTVVDLEIGADFENDLRVFIDGGSTIDVENDADVDVTFNINADVNNDLLLSEDENTIINLTDAGKGRVALNVVVDNFAQQISDAAAAAGNGNDVLIDNVDQTAEIDFITLLDSDVELDDGDLNAEQEGLISLVFDKAWAQPGDKLVVDASDINDDDADDSLDDSDTQTGSFDARDAVYLVDLKATQLDDLIYGSNQADKLDGQAGQDIILGGLGADTLTGGADDDFFAFGADYFGAGGSTSVQESNPSSIDTITDFVTGKDHLVVGVTLSQTNNGDPTDNFIGNDNVVNFGRFASVANGALGDDSLDGTSPARVIGDHYYSVADGRYAVDVDGNGDITSADFAVKTAQVNSSDVSFAIETGAGNDLIRTGTSADDVDAGDGDDKLVFVGSIDSNQAGQYILDAGLGAFLAAEGLDRVLSESELENVRTESEIGSITVGATTQFDNIDGGNDIDTIYAFGNANFVGVTITDVENLVIGSNVTITVDQLLSFSNITFAGASDHELHVIDAGVDGDYGTDDDFELDGAALAALFNPPGSGPNIINAGTGTVLVGEDGVLLDNLLQDAGNDLSVEFQSPEFDVINAVESTVTKINFSGIDNDVTTATLTISDTDVVTPDVTFNIDLATLVGGVGFALVDVSSLTDGNITVSITQDDGVSGAYTSGVTDTSALDTTIDAPAPVTIAIDDDNDTIADTLSAADVAGPVTITVAGLDGDIDTTKTVVSITDGVTTRIATGTGGNGSYTVDLTGFIDGTVTASVTTEDGAGNVLAPVIDKSVLDTTADVGGDVSFAVIDANGDGYINIAELNAITAKVTGLDVDINTSTFVAGIDDDSDAFGADVYASQDFPLSYDAASYDPVTGEATFSGSYSDLGTVGNNLQLFLGVGFFDNAGNKYEGAFSVDPAQQQAGLILDTKAPTITSIDWIDGGGLADTTNPYTSANPDVTGNREIIILFGEDVTVADSTGFRIFQTNGVELSADSFTVSVVGGNSIWVDPIGTLTEQTGGTNAVDYYMTISGTAVVDAAGNAFAGIAGNTAITWDVA